MMLRQSIITRSAVAPGLSIFSSRVTAVRPPSRDGCSTVVSWWRVPSPPARTIKSHDRHIVRHPQSGLLGDRLHAPAASASR